MYPKKGTTGDRNRKPPGSFISAARRLLTVPEGYPVRHLTCFRDYAGEDSKVVFPFASMTAVRSSTAFCMC